MGNGPTEDVLTGHCINCGRQVQPEAVYCTSCGVPVLPPPKRRPLFVDEVEDAPAPPPPPDDPPAPEPEPTSAVRPPFFANAEVDPPRPRRRRLTPVVLALLFVALAGAVGWMIGKGGDPAAQNAGPATPSTSPAHSGGASTSPSVDPSAPPQEQLLRISRLDTRSASKLVGTWVPQLAAVSAGVGGDSGWTDALSHYQRLKSDYPDALLLDTGEWPSSYVKSGMYAVVVPLPSHDSRPALEWCVEHSLSKNDCAAKHLDTSGDPDNNFDAQ